MLLQLPLFQSLPLLEQFHQHMALIDGSERERMERMEMRGKRKEIKENENKEKESKPTSYSSHTFILNSSVLVNTFTSSPHSSKVFIPSSPMKLLIQV